MSFLDERHVQTFVPAGPLVCAVPPCSVGNTLVCFVASKNNLAPDVISADWTFLGIAGAASAASVASYIRVVDGSEPASYTFDWSAPPGGGNRGFAVILAYSNLRLPVPNALLKSNLPNGGVAPSPHVMTASASAVAINSKVVHGWISASGGGGTPCAWSAIDANITPRVVLATVPPGGGAFFAGDEDVIAAAMPARACSFSFGGGNDSNDAEANMVIGMITDAPADAPGFGFGGHHGP